MPWLTGVDDLAEVEKYWPSAAEADPDELVVLLAAAQVQCEAFAPSLVTVVDGVEVVAEPPVNYLKAQALQARALYRSSIAGSGDGIGADGFTVTVFPMDWTVKSLLRPKRGKPVVK